MLSTLTKKANSTGIKKQSNEDAFFIEDTEEKVWGVVCDGCSTGINSSWASSTICYLVKKCGLIKFGTLVRYIANGIIDLRSLLGLTEMNFLSTIILFSYYKEKKILRVLVLGDGNYWVNGERFTVDQNNTPDYLAYHSEDKLESYIDKYKEEVYENVHFFCISTDGMDSFIRSQFVEPTLNPEILIEKCTNPNYLTLKFNLLSRDKWEISDDLTIINYVS